MAKVVQFDAVGGPETLVLRDIPVADPGPGQVRITVKAIGLNRAEALFRSGTYFEQPAFPATNGYEGAGIIDAVGPDVKDFAIGDAVSVAPAFSLNDYGFYADTALAPAAAVIKHPATLSFEEAAAVWMAYLTAYDALLGTAQAAKGEFVVIPAASSSVGIAAIQVANMLGAIPIALTRTSAKRVQIEAVGAQHVIVTEEQDVVERLAAITDGKGVQVVFDPVGGPTFAKLLQAAAPRARVMLYGTIGEPTVVPHFPVFTKSLVITGALLFNTTFDATKLKAGVAWVAKGLESGELKPVIAKTFPLELIVEAQRYMESNQQFGKIVVVP
jgi:NADPH:quinone reductase-like Zn-dependent oxidoreductase